MNCRNLIKRLVLPALFLLTGFTVLAQNRTITGRVNDARGAGLVGVTVAVKGQNAATATNETGQFSINVPANATTLVFSSVGFGQQEFTLGASNTVTVTLSQLSGNLNEVVVVGYGTQRRKDLTASVATVSAKDFNKGLNTTPEQLIQGKVAGVQVTSNGGAPGSGSVIRIRGGASLSATNDPLIVIDGVPVSNNGIAGAANVLATINPNDIESFNILKDASATAIYGSRASNGVILITTKKGTRGDKLKISVSSLASLSKRTNQVDVLTGDEIRAYVNANGTAGQKALLGSSNTNWQDVVFRDAFSHEHTVSLSGGFKPLPYRFSVGYLDQEGILKTSNIQRTTGSLGLFPSLFDKHLNIIANLKATHTDNRFADEGAIGNAITFDPTQPVYQKNNYGGYFEWLDVTSGKPNTLSNRNPLALLDMRDDRSRVNRLIGNIQLDYKLHFFPDLRANLNLGYDYQEGNGRVMIPATAATQVTSANGAKGTGSRYNAENKNKVLEFFLNYAKELKNIRSRIDVTGGYSYQDFQYGGKNFAALDYFGDVIPNTTLPQYPNYFNQQTLLSYWGRFNMTFSEKYILSAIVRRDASSLFAKENRWGTFPAVSFAWRMKDEGFLKDVNALSDLKLRIGYGVTGQQDITGSAGYYPYIPGYFLGDSSSMYQFGSGFVQTYAPKAYNNRLKWEETETINLGLDFGFFKGRLNGSIEVFRKTSNDLLANVALPVTTNFTNEFVKNIGRFEAKGLEFSLNATPVKTRSFNWDLGFNATFIKRNILQLDDAAPVGFAGYEVQGISGGTGNRIKINTVGYEPQMFYVYKQVYDAGGKPIDGLYADLNRDGIINSSDRYRYRSAQPDATLGLNSQLTYNKISLGFSARSNIGNYMYSNINSGAGVGRSVLNPLNYIGNATRDLLSTNFNNNQYFSDYYVSNASFVKIDYISLGYNFGQLGHSKANLRLSANVQNVHTFTKYKGLDPEIFSGVDNQIYPRPRIFSLGVNLDY